MTERGGDFFRKKQRGEEWGWREREDEEIRDDTLSHTRTEREREREGDSERDCTGTGGWGWGGLLWDARTQWHDTDALSYCAESSGWGEEGTERERRGGRRRGDEYLWELSATVLFPLDGEEKMMAGIV